MPNSMALVDQLLAHAERSRRSLLLTGLALCSAIIAADWQVQPNVSLGLLYIFPVVLFAIVLSRLKIAIFSALCSLMRETFAPFRGEEGYELRLFLVWLAFFGVGLFVSELKRSHALTLGHMKLLRAVVETTPLAVLVLNAKGRVDLANDSAARLFGYQQPAQFQGERIEECLPTLAAALAGDDGDLRWRASLSCNGRRLDGNSFHANVWLSTFDGPRERQLVAAVWDESESLRSREVAGWEALVSSSRLVIGGYMHELRNLASEAASIQKRLESQSAASVAEDVRTMGAVLRGMQKIAATGLSSAAVELSATASLAPVIEELRILAGPTLLDLGIRFETDIPPDLPLVHADHHTLLQVLLNLFRNACRELEAGSQEKAIRLAAAFEPQPASSARGVVKLWFSDNGPPVPDATQLFRPFFSGSGSAGLGLFISQALMRAHGGELRYEVREGWPCFVLEMIPVHNSHSAS